MQALAYDHGHDLDLDLIVRTTPSSYASFEIVAARLAGAPALITTVDAIMPAGAFQHFVSSAASFPDDAVVLGLTDHVDDENPLWAILNGEGRVLRLGGDQGSHVTAGLYWLPADRGAEPKRASTVCATISNGWSTKVGPSMASLCLSCSISIGRTTSRPPSTPGSAGGERRRMTTGFTCFGVLREPSHSPGRIDDDAAIMRRVGEALTERGFKVD